MSDLKLSFTIEALDHVTRTMRQIREGVGGAMRDVRQAVDAGLGQVERFGGSAGGILASVGMGLELRNLVKNEDYFNRLRVQMNMTKQAASDLHQEIVAAARGSKTPIDELMSALRSSVELTGDVRNFRDNLQTTAAAIAILGGQGDEVGRVLADLDKHFKIGGPEEMRRTLAALELQSHGMPGGFASIVTGLDRVAESWAKIRGTGARSALEFGALFGTLASGTGSSRRASGDLEMILGAFGDKTGELYGRMIAASGLREWGTNDVPRILRAIAEQYKKNPLGTSSIIGSEFARDISQIDFDMLNRKLAVTGDSAKFMNDAAEASKSLAGELNALHGALEQFEERELTGPLNFLTKFIQTYPDASADLVGLFGTLALFSLVISPLRGALMFMFRALGLVRAEAPLTAASIAKVGAEAQIAGAKLDASQLALGRFGRGLQLRAGLGLLNFGFMIGDIQKAIGDMDAAQKAGPAAVEELNRQKRQSFGDRAFGWIPGLSGIDWNAQPHASQWLRRQLGLESPASPSIAARGGGIAGVSDADLTLAARTLLGEAGNQGRTGMEAVADVLRNRLASGAHGKSLHDVIMQRLQFSMWNGGDNGQFADDARLPSVVSMLRDVFAGRRADLTGGAMNYYNPDLASPAWGPKMSGQKKIGAHLFGTAPGEPGFAGGGKHEVTIKLAEAPKGTRASVTRNDPGLDVALDMGWSMETP